MIFKKKKYKSDISEFIVDLKFNNPNIENTQKLGRAILWDKTSNSNKKKNEKKSNKIKQPSYVYF